MRRDGHALVLGATLHHISNWNRASPNRGLNSFVVFGGVSRFREGPSLRSQ